MSKATELGVKEFEGTLGLPEGFLLNLLQEDDWSFVIKLNTLFEAATSSLLSSIYENRLVKSLDTLTHSTRIQMIEELCDFQFHEMLFLKKMNALRNKLAHKVELTSFSFSAYILTLEDEKDKKKNNFATEFGVGVKKTINIDGHSVSRREFVLDNPKIAIWLSSAVVLSTMYWETQCQLDGHKRDVALRGIETVLRNYVEEFLSTASPENDDENN